MFMADRNHDQLAGPIRRGGPPTGRSLFFCCRADDHRESPWKCQDRKGLDLQDFSYA